MIRIDVLYEQINYKAHGCGHVRLLGPFSHPRNEGRLLMRAGQSFQPGADAVIVERFWRPHSITLAEAGSLIRRIREAGSTFIYTLDDNLIDMEIIRHDRQGIPMRLSAVAHLFAPRPTGSSSRRSRCGGGWSGSMRESSSWRMPSMSDSSGRTKSVEPHRGRRRSSGTWALVRTTTT